MTVLCRKKLWPFRAQYEMRPDDVTTWLRPLFAHLALPDASRPEVELTHSGERIFVLCALYAGGRGIRAVHMEIADAHRGQPIEEYVSELTTVIDRMQGLARFTGARLLVEGEDMTSARVPQILDRIM